MTSSFRSLAIAGAGAILSLTACSRSSTSSSVPAIAPADFTGVWSFNAEASTQRPAMRGGGGGMGGMGGRGGRGGGGRPPGGGMPGGGGMRGGGPPPETRRPSGDSAGMRLGPANLLTISQTDSTFTLRQDNGVPVTLFFDGRTVADSARGQVALLSGHWRKKRYEVTRQIGATVIIESFERSTDRTKLTVRTKIRNGDHQSPETTRVYDWIRRE